MTITEKSVTEKAERLGFRLVKKIYGGYAIVDKNDAIVAPEDAALAAFMGITLEAANEWLNRYFQS